MLAAESVVFKRKTRLSYKAVNKNDKLYRGNTRKKLKLSSSFQIGNILNKKKNDSLLERWRQTKEKWHAHLEEIVNRSFVNHTEHVLTWYFRRCSKLTFSLRIDRIPLQRQINLLNVVLSHDAHWCSKNCHGKSKNHRHRD